MSYCRFNHWSDLYVYECFTGFVCLVAKQRRIYDTPPEPMPVTHDAKELFRWYQAHVNGAAKGGEFEDINHKYAGRTFSTSTAAEMGEIVMMLEREGFRVPEGVADALFAEPDCPQCGARISGQDEMELFGWHGKCAKCVMEEE